MKVFLSYAHNDSFLAKEITYALEERGLDVWNAEMQILPGDNFAEKTSEALKESDAMIVLITPESLNSKNVLMEIGFALGNISYDRRVIPVLVGSEENISWKNIPWILRKLHMAHISNPEQTDEVIDQIAEVLMRSPSTLSK